MANETSTYELKADAQQFIAGMSGAAEAYQRLQKLLNTNYDDASRSLGGVGSATESVGRSSQQAASQVQTHSTSLKDFQKSAEGAHQALSGFAATSLGTIAGLAGFSVLQSVSQGIKGLVGGFIDANAKTESWQVTMNSLLGAMNSAGDGQAKLAEAAGRASEQFSTKWREAAEKRSDAEVQYSRRHQDLEQQLDDLDGRAVAKRVQAFEKGEADRDHAHSQTILHLEQRQDDLDTKYERSVDDQLRKWEQAQEGIDRKHSDVTQGIKADQDDLARDYDEKVKDRTAKWKLHLDEMEAGHLRTVKSLEDQMTDLARDTADKLADLEQSYSNRREDASQRFIDRQTDLTQSLNRARTPQQRQSIQEQLRDLQRTRDEEQKRLDRDEEQARARLARETQQRAEALQKRIDEENRKYEEQRAFQERQQELQITADARANDQARERLQQRMDAADVQYQRETDAAEATRDAAIAAADETHAKAVDAIKSQIDETIAEYERGKEQRQAAQAEELADLEAQETAKRERIQQAIARLDEDHLKTLRDLGEAEEQIAKEQGAAIKTALEGPAGARASTLSIFQRLGLDDADMKTKLDELQKHIEDIGTQTPLTIQSLMKSVQNLVTVGIDPTRMVNLIDKDGQTVQREFLNVVGDWVAAFKGLQPGVEDVVSHFFAYVQGGRLGEAMEQLRQLGINPKDLEEFGVHFNKAGEIVEGQAAIIDGALQLVQRNFGGVAEAQSHTWEGIISNLQDFSQKLLRIAGAPFFEALRDKVSSLYAALTNEQDPTFRDQITAFATLIGVGLANAIETMADAVGQAIPVFAGLKNAADDDLTPLQRILIQVRDAVAGLSTFLSANGDRIKTAIIGIGAAFATFAVVGSIIALLNPVSLVLVGIAAAAGVLAVAWTENWGDIQGKTQAVVDFIQSHMELVHGAISLILGPLGALASAWANNWGDIQGKTQAVVTFLTQTAAPAIGAFLSALGDAASRLLDLLGRGPQAVSDAFAELLSTAAESFQHWWGEQLTNWGRNFEEFGTSVHDWLLGDSGVIRSWRDFFTGIGDAIGSWKDDNLAAWGRVFDQLGTSIHDWLLGSEGVITHWTEWLGSIKDAVETWWTETLEAWGHFFDDLGTHVHDGLVGDDGILTKWKEGLEGLKDALTTWVGERVEDFVHLFEGITTTVGNAFNTGGNVAAGWLAGLGELKDSLVDRLWGGEDSLLAQWGELFRQIGEAIGGVFADGGAILVAWLGGLNDLKDRLIGKLWGDEDSLIAQIQAFGTAAATAMSSAAQQSWDAFIGKLGDVTGGFGNWVQEHITSHLPGGGGAGEAPAEAPAEEGNLSILGLRAGTQYMEGLGTGLQNGAAPTSPFSTAVNAIHAYLGMGGGGNGLGFGLGAPYPGGISGLPGGLGPPEGGPAPTTHTQIGGAAYVGGGLAGFTSVFGEGAAGYTGTRNNAMEGFASGAYPGSGLAAWRMTAPGLNFGSIYQNSPPGYGPALVQPTTSSIFARTVGPTTPGPQGMTGPSYDPNYLQNALYQMNPVNATIAAGLGPRPEGWTLEEWQRYLGILPPQMAEGGIVTDATTITAGEGAYPEAILPLPPGGATVQIARFQDLAMIDWAGRFVPIWMDLLQTKVSDVLTAARSAIVLAVDQSTKATRDLLPLVVPFTGASSALQALVPSQATMTTATLATAANITAMATQMHLDLVGVQQASTDPSIGQKLDRLHDDLTGLSSSTGSGNTSLGGRLDSLIAQAISTNTSLGAVHSDLVGARVDLAAVNTNLVNANAIAAYARDRVTPLHDDLVTLTQGVVNLLGATAGSDRSNTVINMTTQVRDAINAQKALLDGDIGAVFSAVNNVAAGLISVNGPGFVTAANASTSAGNNIVGAINQVITALNTTNQLLGVGDFGAVGNKGINRLLMGYVGTGDGRFHLAEYADGGLVTRAMMGLVGEAGPELIVPLDRVQAMFERMPQAATVAPVQQVGGGITAVYSPTIREDVSEGTFEDLIWRLDQQYKGRY